MNIPYLMAGMPLGVFGRLLARNGISPWPKYFFRTLFILQSGFWASFLARREEKINGKRIDSCVPPGDPLIIVGHWRTGSTLLHQLLACDPELAAPTLFQVTYPGSFMSSRRYAAPIMKQFIGPTRPIDNVKAGLDEPMEEEDAIHRSCGISPYERLLFPRSGEYFLLRDETFLPSSPEKQEIWEKSLLRFVTKLHLHTGRRVVLKNPFHSMRIPTLARLFPNARFINITRDPLRVVPSTIRMWATVQVQNALKSHGRAPTVEEVSIVLDRLLRRVRADLASLPRDRSIEIRFEELEKNPASVVKDCYRRLGMEFTPAHKKRLSSFLESVAGYTKSGLSLAPIDQDLVRSIVGAAAGSTP